MQAVSSSAHSDPALIQTSVNPEDLTANSNGGTHRKTKKRHHADEDVTSGINKGRKKKRRKTRDEQRDVDGHSELTTGNARNEEPSSRKRKKATTQISMTDSDMTTVDPNAQAAALLTAIVAAAVTGPSEIHSSSQQPPIPPPLPFHPHMMPPYMPFPSLSYDFPLPHFGADGSTPPPHLLPFPPPLGLPLSELTFGSNEEVLRALQDLDMSKITSVLKSIGDTGQASGPPCGLPPPSFITPLPEQTEVNRVGRIPTSNTIMGVPSKQHAVPTHHRRTLDMSLPSGNAENTDPQHAKLLATKWLSAGKLAELVRTEGLVFKKGKFSAIEEQQLKAAMEKYRTLKGLTEEQLQELIFPKNEKSKNTEFWTDLTEAVPQRPIIAVYHHVRRAYHTIQPKGPWTPSEDALLKQAVTDLGQRWEKVSERVGRRAGDCRDRYRNHIQGRDKRVTGPWSKAEEDKLTRIVTDMTINQGRDIDNDVFWGKVSELMDGTRGRQQCRIKWTDALSKTVKNDGQKPRWGQQDAFILVHKIDSLNVRDDTEIDWKTLSDPDWNLWSAHTLQRRWLTMKRSIKGFEDMTHKEIIDILRIKKGHHSVISPPTQSKKRKERKVTSSEAVSDPTDANGNPNTTNLVSNEDTESSASDGSSSDSGSGTESD